MSKLANRLLRHSPKGGAGWGLLLLLFIVVGKAQAGIDYIGQALDLSTLANGSSTEVVVRAAGNDAGDASYGFVWFDNSGTARFRIDTSTRTKDDMKAQTAAYTFTLIKTAEGTYRLQEHENNRFLPGFTSGTGGFMSSANDHTFNASENAACVNYLDNTHCYSLTYSATGGFPVLKGSNYFQVNNSNPTLYLQFFRYASADEYTHFPALYSSEAISTLRTALASAQDDNQANEAFQTLYASANRKVITIKSTTTAYDSQGTEYLYVDGNDAKTAEAPASESSKYFLVEYAENGNYRLMSLANKQYLAPTTGKSSTVDANKSQGEAGLYAFQWNTAGSADSHVVLACQNATGTGAETYYALHRNGSHNLVTWDVSSAASFWTIEPVDFTITYRYVKADDQSEITTTTYEHMSYGDPLPQVEAQDGYMLLTQVEGTVEGTRTYTIVCLDLNGADQTDPEKPATVNLTYNLVGPDGTVWYVEDKGSVANESAYPAISVAMPYGVAASVPNGIITTMQSALTVDIPCTVTTAFKFADSYEHIKSWYNVAIHGGNRFLFNYNESDTYMELSETTGTTDKYLFAFVGNPFTGYKIYNREAGSTKVLSAPDPTIGNGSGKNTGEDATPVMTALSNIPSGNNTTWDFSINGAGLSVSRHGETNAYLNQRDDAVSGKNVLAFWTHANAKTDNGSRIFLTETLPDLGTSTTSPTTPSGEAPAHGKVYRIYTNYNAGQMISEDLTNNGLVKTNQKTIHDGRQLWVALQTDATNNGFQLINVETGRYMQSAGTSEQSITTTEPTTVYLMNTTNDSGYGICEKADGSGSRNLNTNGSIAKVVGWSWNANGSSGGSNWLFEEIDYDTSGEYALATIKERVKANNLYATLTSGNYYRLVNKHYPDRRMVENYAGDEKVRGLENNAVSNLNAQIWHIGGDNISGYTLQNVLTGHYIQDPTSGNQYATTAEEASARRFLTVAEGDPEWGAPSYAFYRTNDDYSLHCNASKNIVTWTYIDTPASYWNLEPVELTNEELTAIQEEYQAYLNDKESIDNLNANTAGINATLATIFTDASCSELNDTYKALSDYRIGLAFDAMGLPAAIKQMALCVKHQTWEADKDATYNTYVRDFRIADYEPYSDRHKWQQKTKVGAFGQLVNPTGITVKTGDILYIYVGDDVKDSDAQLRIEVAEGTAATGTQSQDLHKGINIYQATGNGEIFVFYNVTNTDKYVYATKDHEADYPNIRIHIEGGKATGMWDAHRGMTDAQWDYLCQNMFGAEYLHIKGHNTVINCYTEKARGAQRLTDVMRIWDYIFMTEERLIGHDGQWDGRYKPVMTARDQISGNPNWSGTSINLNDINKNGELNLESLMNERWVIYHEEAHGHQYPVNLVGTTESSNNGFAQMVNHEFGISSRRDDGVKTLVRFKNNGWGWVDMLRGGEGASRTAGFADHGACVWVLNHMFYQLYLYFHVAGNMPDFWPRLCDKMREYGGLVQHGNDANNPTLYYEDYLLFAKACAAASETDLSEFFDTWGFFGYYDDVKVGNEYEAFSSKDNGAAGIRYIGDYGHYYLKMPMRSNPDDVARINAAIAEMKAYPKKAPNIMFIDDHILPRTVAADCFAAQIDPSRIGQTVAYYGGTSKQGDFGDYAQFTGTNEANALDYSIEGTTVTMSGTGLVGVKIYDADGNLKYIYNTESFEVPAEVATALSNGTYTLVAALGNDTNLPLAKPSAQKHTMVIYNGTEDNTQTYKVTGEAAPANVPYSILTGSTDVPAITGNTMVLMPEESDIFAVNSALGTGTTNVFINHGTVEEPQWEAMYVNFADKADFYLPEGNYMVAGMTSYSRTNTAGLNSVCLPFDTQASNYGSGVKTYVLKEKGDNSITFVETTRVIPAGTFYLVDCGENGAAWSLGGSELSLIGSPLVSDEGSQGSFQNKTIGEGMYKLNSAGTKFGITTSAGTVTAFRGYLNLPAANGTRQFVLSLEDAPIVTGVDEVQTLQPTYATDLQGRTTLTLQRGKTYVINGKKTLAR